MFNRAMHQLRSQHSPESEGEEPAPKRQKLEPVEPETIGQGRPYQAFVESEASRFREGVSQAGNRTEPALQEIRTRAMPVLQLDIMERVTGKSHYAVAGEEQHGLKGYRSTSQLSEASASPTYIDTLRQLKKDACWASRRFSLERMDWSYSPSYDTYDPVTGRLVPRAGSLIQRPRLETVEEEPMETDPVERRRPYHAFVESEVSRFREEMSQAGNRTEPDPEKVRTVAMHTD